jgi:hypothetical protein
MRKLAHAVLAIAAISAPTSSFAVTIKWCPFNAYTGKQIGTMCFPQKAACERSYPQSSVECVAVQK